MLANEDSFAAVFKRAISLHERTPDAFEAARTRLAFGQPLRRPRNRVLAREQLRTAVDDFDRLGARPWADRARAELAATGETRQRRDRTGIDDLTPQELQVALLLTSGKTTRETAGQRAPGRTGNPMGHTQGIEVDGPSGATDFYEAAPPVSTVPGGAVPRPQAARGEHPPGKLPREQRGHRTFGI